MREDIVSKIEFLENKFNLNLNSKIFELSSKETSLQTLWFEHLLPRELKTIDGSKLYVEQTGFWNHASGPDFLNAKVIWENGSFSKGDVELHIKAKDWFNHNHHSDPKYANVILHVTLFDDEPTLHITKGAIKSVQLYGQIDDTLIKLITEVRPRDKKDNLPDARPGDCSKIFHNFSSEEINQVLHDAGLFRLHRKALYIHKQCLNDGEIQTLWEHLATCLGFSENKIPFKMLARMVPYSLIQSCSTDERDALLFGASGFLPKYEISTRDEESRRYLKKLWNIWWSHPISADICENSTLNWSFAPLRPLNHPHRRVAALSSMSQSVGKLLDYLREFKLNESMKILSSCSHEHFDFAYTIFSNRSHKKTSLIGHNRVAQIVWNCFIPWILGSNSDWNNEWLRLPPEPENIRLKRAVQRIFPCKSIPQLRLDGLSRQGLIEILESFCSESSSDCTACNMPKVLEQKYLKISN
jgi:hypothetical protein